MEPNAINPQKPLEESLDHPADWRVEVWRALKLLIASLALLFTVGVIFYCGNANQARLGAGGELAGAVPAFAISALCVAATWWLFTWANRDRAAALRNWQLNADTAEAQVRQIGSIRRYGEVLQAQPPHKDDPRQVM